jgi:hypothetical protein
MNQRIHLMRLRDQAVRDALELSNDELRQEDARDGIDSLQAAESLRVSMREAAARALRESRTASMNDARSVANRIYPSIERIKALVKDAFVRQPNFGLAFRDGRKQSDKDWTSLYDDLVDMGAIDPDAD